MEKQGPEGPKLTRREAMVGIASVGLGAAMLMAGAGEIATASAQAGLPDVIPPAPNPKFPQVPSWKTELRKLAPNVYAYTQAGGPGIPSLGISNAGLIIGEERMMAIDTLGAPLQTKAFMAAAKQASGGKPFGLVVDTHHHTDHVSGNQFIAPPQIMGHPYCRQEVVKMAKNTPKMWEKRAGWAEGTEPRVVVPPNVTFEDNLVVYEGGTEVHFHFMAPAHTWGDVVAYLPQHKILFAGDLAFFYVAPFAHNGYVTKWLERIDQIMAMDVDTIVPGHGPVGGKKELAETAEYFHLLKTEARKRYDAGMSAGKAAADIRLGKFDNWLGPERIVMNTERLYLEFSGKITPDVDYAGITKATEEYNAIKSGKAA